MKEGKILLFVGLVYAGGLWGAVTPRKLQVSCHETIVSEGDESQGAQQAVVKGSLYAQVRGFIGGDVKVYRTSVLPLIARGIGARVACYLQAWRPKVQFFDANNRLLSSEPLTVRSTYANGRMILRGVQTRLEQRQAVARAEMQAVVFSKNTFVTLYDKDDQRIITLRCPKEHGYTGGPLPQSAQVQLKKYVSNPEALETIRLSKLTYDPGYGRPDWVYEVAKL